MIVETYKAPQLKCESRLCCVQLCCQKSSLRQILVENSDLKRQNYRLIRECEINCFVEAHGIYYFFRTELRTCGSVSNPLRQYPFREIEKFSSSPVKRIIQGRRFEWNSFLILQMRMFYAKSLRLDFDDNSSSIILMGIKSSFILMIEVLFVK